MARGVKRNSTNTLVDLKHGLISREIFVSEDISQQEQEQIFARCWLFVGHESQIPKPGDYFVSCMGEESVILTRDSQHQIHVFLNTCRHRGMKVCRYDEGNTAVFTCPYHGRVALGSSVMAGAGVVSSPMPRRRRAAMATSPSPASAMVPVAGRHCSTALGRQAVRPGHGRTIFPNVSLCQGLADPQPVPNAKKRRRYAE